MTYSPFEQGSAPVVGHVVWRVSQEGEESIEAAVPAEGPLAIEVNGQLAAVLMRTPGSEKALALGYCLSEGLVTSLDDVLLLHHCGSGTEDDGALGDTSAKFGPGNRVRLEVKPEAAAPVHATRWVFSGCAGVNVDALGAGLQVGQGELRVRPEALWEAAATMAQAQVAYRTSGGVHAAALFDPSGALLVLGEDVGRHNAVDKAIGEAALRRLRGAILVATGRASSDIVAKAARVGVPIVASFSSSTTLGVRLAQAAGVTLIGYLRRNRFTIYSHPRRIAIP